MLKVENAEIIRMKYGEILKPDMNTVCMLFFQCLKACHV